MPSLSMFRLAFSRTGTPQVTRCLGWPLNKSLLGFFLGIWLVGTAGAGAQSPETLAPRDSLASHDSLKTSVRETFPRRTLNWGLALVERFAADTHKTVRILPGPVLGYAPETGWMTGVVVAATFRVNPGERASNIRAEVDVTQNRQFIADFKGDLYFNQNRQVISFYSTYRIFPEFWWGIGNDQPEAARERLDLHRQEAHISWLWQPNRRYPLYIGPRAYFQHTYNLETEPGGLLEAREQEQRVSGISSALGITMAWDTRRYVLAPERGVFVWAQYLPYRQAFGSDFVFDHYQLDVRGYIPLAQERGQHTLGLHGFAEYNEGDAPFRLMGLMGSNDIMRGYYRGRFRDNTYLAGQAEYRFPIGWRIRGATFAGLGRVAQNLEALSWQNWKPAVGAGLRFRYDDLTHAALRTDFAWSPDSGWTFYVAFSEAF